MSTWLRWDRGRDGGGAEVGVMTAWGWRLPGTGQARAARREGGALASATLGYSIEELWSGLSERGIVYIDYKKWRNGEMAKWMMPMCRTAAVWLLAALVRCMCTCGLLASLDRQRLVPSGLNQVPRRAFEPLAGGACTWTLGPATACLFPCFSFAPPQESMRPFPSLSLPPPI